MCIGFKNLPRWTVAQSGESLGQVASQTLPNLAAVYDAAAPPILAPLIGLNKMDVVEVAKRIGTFDISTRESASCPYLPGNPLTMARLTEFKKVLAEVEASRPEGSE